MKRRLALLLLVIINLFSVKPVMALEPTVDLRLTVPETPQDVVGMLNIFLLLTVLSLAPAILVLLTSFTRTVIVLSFTRNALATQQVPPNQVIIGLSLFLTLFIMAPVFAEINEQALQPYLAGELTHEEALQLGQGPLREFMLAHTRAHDLELFTDISGVEVESLDEVPLVTLIPAFVISELKTAFQMGFLIFVPFLVIDMVIASTLMSMGMMMLPPVMISLPFKILLFVLVDGWHLVVKSLLQSF
ncbi:MAG: flagellar type III secretion system pore protein FliP [Firmicutes bacterium]|nr:flagellar type III secretion system pore protein FliP [Bacillota bacterium]